MIQFDKQGYLFSHEIIELSLTDFEANFVAKLPDKDRRKEIFEMYLQYLSELFEVVGKDFYQLVNGSFTTKKELPGDIDLTTFVDYRICRDCEDEIVKLGDRWENERLIDSYIIPLSYQGHPRFLQTQLAYEYWKNLYSMSKPDGRGHSNPKGLIKINFSK